MAIYLIIVVGIGIYFLILVINNSLWLYFNTKKTSVYDGKHVTVCVPARNEQNNIENCIRSLMNQSYINYDVLVLDDNSTDDTKKIIQHLVHEYPFKLKMISGRRLPSEWSGKVYAMYQLVNEAKGEYLLFTDADTVHNQNSISFAVTNLEKHNADMISGYISQKMKTFGEQITVPLMYLLTSFVMPLFLNKITHWNITSIAIGQYILIKKNVLESVGGYQSMKNVISEDVVLARLVKKYGYKTVFIDCKQASSCRMYNNYRESVQGLSKNIFSFMNNKTYILIPAIIAVTLFLFMPFPMFVFSFIQDFLFGYEITIVTILLGINVFLMFFVWLINCFFQKIPIKISFLYPILFINLICIALLSFCYSSSGTGFVWKGRVVH